jgi:uncharacterized peroxidase-related enzyme
MTRFPSHTLETAPEAARPTLEAARKAYGIVPNLYGKMAEAPALADGYWALSQAFEKTSLTPTERQVVLIAVSRFNGCCYCVAVHSAIADMSGVPRHVTDALRDDRPIGAPRLEALRRFTTAVVEARGLVPEAEVERFTQAGFGASQVLEVVLGVGLKTLSNYTNHLADTELDAVFADRAWQEKEEEGERAA